MPSASPVECHRFFAISKRVPKDVKRFCGICRQHGKLEETRGHVCQFKDCECAKCNLVRSRRLVMSQQIRLRRAQDKRFQRTNEPEEADVVPLVSTTATATMAHKEEEGAPMAMAAPAAAAAGGAETEQQLMEARNMCYFCQKCKNHGILVWKKHHKRQCPFTECTCDFCELIETRRRLDQHIKRRKSAPQEKNGRRSDEEEEEDEELRGPPRKKSTASLPAHIEAAMACGKEENSPSREESPLGEGADQPQQEQQQSRIRHGRSHSGTETIFRNTICASGTSMLLGEPGVGGSPLDALSAQLSRIHQQRESPVAQPQRRGSNSQSPSAVSAAANLAMALGPTPVLLPHHHHHLLNAQLSPTASSSCSATCSPAPPHQSVLLPALDPLHQLLLSSSSCSVSNGSSSLFNVPPSSSLMPFGPLGAVPSSSVPGLPASIPAGFNPLQLLSSLLVAPQVQQVQQQPRISAELLAALLNDPMLPQLLLVALGGGGGGTPSAPPAAVVPSAGDAQRELLLQIIAKLLEQEQHHQQLLQQQQQQQLQNPVDPALLALIMQQQQNDSTLALGTAKTETEDPQDEEEGNSSSAFTSVQQQQQQQRHNGFQLH